MIYLDENGKINLSKLHPAQQDFIKSKHLHTGIVGGYQSGKSTVAAIKAVLHLLRFPGVPIAYYLPIFRLFDDMLIPKLRVIFEQLGIDYLFHEKKSKVITKYGEIWMRSMDAPDSIVSYSVGYSIVDEVDLVHPNKRISAMRRVSSRNSYKKSEANQIDFVSTPEGFAYMYDFFVKRANSNKLLLRLSTLANESNLADGYIQGLREQYTAEQLKGYLDGDFVNLTSGTCYYKYNRKDNNSTREHDGIEPIHVGIDFNIGNMSAVIHVIEGGRPIAVDEITKAYDTDELCRIINSRYKGVRVHAYPDSSGKNRKTSSTTTDIQILKDANFSVHYTKSNPPVNDRISNMNRVFLNGNGNNIYSVNYLKCPDYSEALEKMAYDSNGLPNKVNGFDHLTDAGGYFIWYQFKVTKHPGNRAL
jgi:hypothetical protein